MKKLIYLPTSFSDKFPSFCLLLLFTVFMGCATQYRHIQPNYMEYSAVPDILDNGNIEITYRYNVLRGANNEKYARMGKKEGICLLAVRITNNGNDTLYFPNDILIESRDGYVFPLEMEDAIDVFIQDHSPVLDELGGATAYVVTINTGWGFIVPLAASIPSLINSSVEAKANDHFVNEMLDYYLVYSNVPPGETVSGLLALPVEPNTPLTFKKN
jgi:hypothetical protein